MAADCVESRGVWYFPYMYQGAATRHSLLCVCLSLVSEWLQHATHLRPADILSDSDFQPGVHAHYYSKRKPSGSKIVWLYAGACKHLTAKRGGVFKIRGTGGCPRQQTSSGTLSKASHGGN